MKTTKKKTGPLYRVTCKSERTLGEESSKRNTRRHRKTGWKLVKEKETGTSSVLEESPGRTQLILKTDRSLGSSFNMCMLGVADTMAALRDEWWIPKLRVLVKKQIRQCNVCKVFTAKPFGAPMTAALPEFRMEASRPFQYTGVDLAGPLKYKVNKREEKAYVLIFTCVTSRVVHLELTRSQTAEEFQRKLNAFIV